jgi:Tol biopolymer transport system component
MNEQEILDRAKRAAMSVDELDQPYDALLRRRDRKRRNQRIAAGVVGIAVFVAAVWVVTTGGSFNRTQQPAVQPTPTPPARTIPWLDYLIDLNTGVMTQLPTDGIAGSPNGYAVSPDGTMLAYSSGVGGRGPTEPATPQIFIANVDFTDVHQVTHGQRGAQTPAWSPDGETIAYASGDYTLEDEDVQNIFVLDLATGETSQVTNENPCSSGPCGAGFPQFSPDGASIVYEFIRGDGWGVRIVPVTGGKSVPLVGDGKNDVEAWGATLSPDGSTLAVTCRGRLEGICIGDADGTNLRTLVSGDALYGTKWSPDGTRIAYFNQAPGLTGDKVFVVDVATGETTFVAEGFVGEWLDDHTLIIERRV